MSDNFREETVWAVRGIPEEIRRAVVGRAKSEGRTVGAWVSEALRRALADENGDALVHQLADLRRRVESLEGGHPHNGGGAPHEIREDRG